MPPVRPLAPLALAAALITPAAAQAADTYLTETFSGATPSNAAQPGGLIAGTGMAVVNGSVWVGWRDVGDPLLNLGSGWYTGNIDPVTQVGSSTVQSVLSFDLLAGTTYTLSFDFSRQAWSAGNGPFQTALTASLGSESITYDEVAGFYYGYGWRQGELRFTPTVDEPDARVVFTAFGPPGYSGMVIDNVSMVGLPTAPVPEPGTYALMALGLGLFGMRRLRRD